MKDNFNSTYVQKKGVFAIQTTAIKPVEIVCESNNVGDNLQAYALRQSVNFPAERLESRPKRESSGPTREALSRDMVPARARCENNVTDQRYHDAVDETMYRMGNLFIQIRIVSSTIDMPSE